MCFLIEMSEEKTFTFIFTELMRVLLPTELANVYGEATLFVSRLPILGILIAYTSFLI